MADIVKVDDKVIKIEVEKQDEKFQVFLNGETRRVEVADDRGSRMTLIVDDKPFDVVFSDDNTIIVNNQEYSVEIFDEQVGRLMKTSAGKSEKRELAVKTAMPGLIIEVTVKKGDKVTEGQGLLIIEAMKMQNEIQTPRDGVVKTIRVEKGQTVNTGDTLIIIE